MAMTPLAAPAATISAAMLAYYMYERSVHDRMATDVAWITSTVHVAHATAKTREQLERQLAEVEDEIAELEATIDSIDDSSPIRTHDDVGLLKGYKHDTSGSIQQLNGLYREAAEIKGQLATLPE
jgi:hypothetical protein